MRNKYAFFLSLILASTLACACTASGFQDRKAIIMLDPGHGGNDTGVKGPDGSTEKSICFLLAKKISKKLRDNNRILLTREGDHNPDPVQRTAAANRGKADLFVSLHTDGSAPQISGIIRIIHLPPHISQHTDSGIWDEGHRLHREQSIRLANSLAKTMENKNLPQRIRIMEADLFLLKPLTMPAVLVETGNLRSPRDALWLADPDNQNTLAEAIANGIDRFIDSMVH
ncbi:N-acetylmuramoyl-L-alanine amidase family protein [Desulfobotulus mexicanus]|uniref:N-acetylmuramoyl-L-alanine amidase n=1 Tax=Desulfobotulus mexicanus TaxID=2586642 RepID=A0A5Q4VE69_9BACT|nr:N-acetylmuramoyl-L-alanine amidase [Desulfobotulus mexicanus]TYT75999.1 N-acetylmuramoyl-L-alanine amidase [Desulfobotulus mexicanus]